jgi:hypothetical protein
MRHLAKSSLVVVSLVAAFTLQAPAQSAALQQKIAAIQASMAKNEQMLGQYTWQEQETVSVRGDVKKTALYSVQLGSDGKPVKTDISQSSPTNKRQFGIRHRIAENYEDYGKQIAALAASYQQVQPGKIQQLYASGNVSLKSGGIPELDAVVVKNYVKPGDSVTIAFSRASKSVVSLNIASYLSDPSDGVTISAQFAKLPDGTNHVAAVTINGQSKSLVVQENNSDYQKR